MLIFRLFRGIRLPDVFGTLLSLKIRAVLKSDLFSATCNIYILHLCYDVSVHLSVCDGSALAHYS